MNFHVTKNDNGEAVDFFVKVTSPVARQKYNGPAHCVCPILYPVVMKTVGREHVKQGARHDGRKYVCECHGEAVP